ncbi:wiskott-Aldrich syndrome protein homolog 1-like isoform X3 [Balaenoptera musculus]|uniref:Wiskott-Aldrich syndrome protein homolog 1-like isoform X3 n=1 Tax=Balaenoptera musculus TaxID=9771 RepID=A0A8B8Z2L8_BALMU|nr:wiskott-Aldrich syndrome protein homolog 1-like isoform X3 [Balaenoptera musculus]
MRLCGPRRAGRAGGEGRWSLGPRDHALPPWPPAARTSARRLPRSPAAGQRSRFSAGPAPASPRPRPGGASASASGGGSPRAPPRPRAGPRWGGAWRGGPVGGARRATRAVGGPAPPGRVGRCGTARAQAAALVSCPLTCPLSCPISCSLSCPSPVLSPVLLCPQLSPQPPSVPPEALSLGTGAWLCPAAAGGRGDEAQLFLRRVGDRRAGALSRLAAWTPALLLDGYRTGHKTERKKKREDRQWSSSGSHTWKTASPQGTSLKGGPHPIS